ncbi:helix-turn-helix transcriptional regulator [Streptosporangium sandarakinum]|uniref:helix-turn-helix transcriptional regulator n=1 Tax=Streptosporangium sandarakinum TaxID=1260955 RepID=UPI0036A5C506
MTIKINPDLRRALGKPKDVAEYLGVPEKTLTQWRYLRKGPKYAYVGRHVRYRWPDVEKWLDQQMQGGSAA